MLALRGAQGVGDDASQAAKSMMGESKPWMKQAGNYYSTLLSGNRAAQAQAQAAPMAQISQQYRGAERGLERSGVRGAARDVAAGELGRERVSKMAGLTTGVQPMAAEALGNLGLNMGNQAGALMGTAGNVYGNLLNSGAHNREYARGEGEKTSTAIGGLTRDISEAVFRPGKQPSTPVVAPPLKEIPRAPGTGPATRPITIPPPGPLTPPRKIPLPGMPGPSSSPGDYGVSAPPTTFPKNDPWGTNARY